MKRIIATACLLLFTAATAAAKELKTVTFSVPKMHCEKCEKKVNDNLRFERGVKEITTDLKTKQVTVTYDAEKTDAEKLCKSFSKFKYSATIVEKPAAKKSDK